jgi:hypothetical protein
MSTYKVWFSHPGGPYSIEQSGPSKQAIREIFRGDPFLIDVCDPDDPPPAVVEYCRETGEDPKQL